MPRTSTDDVAMNVNLVDVVQSHIKLAGMVLVDEVSGKIVESGAEYLASRLVSAGVITKESAMTLRRPLGDHIYLCYAEDMEDEGSPPVTDKNHARGAHLP